MKDRKYLTRAAFGEREKIGKLSMALLCLLINLFNSGLFVVMFFSFSSVILPAKQWEDQPAFQPAAQHWSLPWRRMNPSAQLSAVVHHPAHAEVSCE